MKLPKLRAIIWTGLFALPLSLAAEVKLVTDNGFTVQNSTFTNNGFHTSFTQDTNSNLTFSMLTNTMTFADPLHAINVFSSSTSTGGRSGCDA